MGEQAARDEVRILHRLLERRHDGGTAIGRCELWPPMRGVTAGDDRSHRLDGCGGVGPVVDEARVEPDGGAKRQPEFLLERAASDELAVAGRVELIARGAADEAQLAG